MVVRNKYRLVLVLLAGLWMGVAAAQEPAEVRFFAQLPNEIKAAENDAAAEATVTAEDRARQKADARVAKLKAKEEAKAEAARVIAEQKAKAQAEKQAVAEEKLKQEAETRAARLKARQEAKAEAARVKAEQEAKNQAERQVAAEAKAAKLKARQEAKAEAARLKIEQKAQEKPAVMDAKLAAEPEAQAAVVHAKTEQQTKAEDPPAAETKQAAEVEAARVNVEKKAPTDTKALAEGGADKLKMQGAKEDDFAQDVAPLKVEQKDQADAKAAEAKAAKLKAAKSDMLIDFVQKAVLQNPDVLTRWHNFQAAVNETSAARGGFLPRVDMTIDGGRERSQSPITNYSVNTKNVTVTLTQMLYDGFATLNDVRRLNNAQLARYYELLDASETAALDAARAFYDISRQRKLFELTEDNYVRHRTAFEQIKLKVEAGVGRRVDLEQAAGRLALSESNLVVDNANVHDTSARFQRIIGVLPPAKIRTSPSQAKLAKQVLPNAAAAVLSVAADYHPAILAAVENVRSARYDLHGRRAKYQPTVNLSVAQTRSDNLAGITGATNNASAKITLNWNLYSGGSDSARSSQFAGRLDSAKDLRDKACRDIRMNLAIAYNDISKLTEQLKYLDQHQLAIEKARTAYQKQFDIGQRSLLDLLDTENELYQAKRAYANADFDLAIAYARTIAGMGRLVSSLGIAHLETKDLPELLGVSQDAAENCPIDAPLANNIHLEELDARAIEEAKAANEASRAKEEAGKEQKAKDDNAFLMTPGEAKAAKEKEEQGVKTAGIEPAQLKAGQDAKVGEVVLAKLKAEQEAQMAAEEKAKQAAEAKAVKIKAKQEAKIEAARVKAEKEAKVQAEKQALAEAKAEAARQKAEQKTKAEAEKKMAAEEKANQAAEARAAKLKAKEEAKAEAARLKAEQDAKAEAEAQAQQEAQAKAEAEKQAAAKEKVKQAAEARAAKLKAMEETKAEAARMKAEQQAKAQAEKRAAAEQKAKQEAEARIAKQKANEEAKTEAARLKAEREVKVQAEKQAGQEAKVAKLKAKQEAAAEAARQKAEQKAKIQAEKQAEIEAKLAARIPASSPEILVERWAGNWAEKDVDGYLSYYDTGFRPSGGIDRESWEAKRRSRIAGAPSIKVRVENLKIEQQGELMATARFVETIEVGDYRKASRKQLLLVRRDRDGEWKIREEREETKREAEADAARVKVEQQAQAAAEAEPARLKAEQEARAVTEEKAKQAAEAKAAKIRIKQEAKVEAARVKAEQAAKAQADKQAANAEAARLMAEWIMVGENKILALTTYANPNTEAPPNNWENDDKVKMWGMYDYKSTQEVRGYKFISTKFLDEYDCKQEQIRFLVNTAFSKNMGGGVVVFTNTNAGKWQPVRHGSMNETMLKLACSKKGAEAQAEQETKAKTDKQAAAETE